jgi:DNA-binding transcriptional MocR family regulator
MLAGLDRLGKFGIKFEKPGGGLYFWAKIPRHLSSRQFFEVCRKNGLIFIPSEIFYDNFHKSRDSYIRLSFASAGIDQIREGIIILEKCLSGI